MMDDYDFVLAWLRVHGGAVSGTNDQTFINVTSANQ
jgi:hypothetical protein